MKYAHDMLPEKTLPLKLTETLNASIFVSCFLDFIQLDVLHFLFTSQAYVQGKKWKKLVTDSNEYQENTTSIGF